MTPEGRGTTTQLVGVVVLSAAVLAALGLSVYAVITSRRAIFATPGAAPAPATQARPAPVPAPSTNGRPPLKPEVIIDTAQTPGE